MTIRVKSGFQDGMNLWRFGDVNLRLRNGIQANRN